ncbi:hypothetical protein ACFQ3P_00600 [Paraburkholderia sabiae]|jgi:hypothetical protein|uniref:Uncharacterized protein n=1 Tax=Paraburkholderia sabiae TaxID=273251 RepID=A0ABU9Q8U5_9BURK|nr:hypothetical protein [Paraburkholderia sabiae]WJZ78386.1 hypothetical protein QEN71_30810 [Paraburkholderia sabiae]CAD6507967.1 hypothetical protein LMG24235_00119 [Paraburkholderia sabiae]
MMKPSKLVASAALYAALCMAWPILAAEPAASVVSSAASARPGGLAVTPNLRIYGNKPPAPRPGGKVTPPDKPPVVSVVSPGIPKEVKDDTETGHGQRSGKNLRQFNGADGTFIRQ